MNAKPKWHCHWHIARRTDGQLSLKVLGDRIGTAMRSVGRPPTWWTDDLVKFEGTRLMRDVMRKDPSLSRYWGKVFVQQ